MSTITTLGLRARALEAAERGVEKRRQAAEMRFETDVEMRSLRTTRLVSELFDLFVPTITGEVEIDGLRLGARWLTVAGYTTWRLCLLETCQLCRRDVATPLTAGEYTLGTLLRERERGVEPCHRPEVNCLRGGAS